MRVRKNVLLTGMITLAAVSILLAGCTDMRDAKPVIYLYPEQTQEVSVQLELDGKLTCADPEASRPDKLLPSIRCHTPDKHM